MSRGRHRSSPILNFGTRGRKPRRRSRVEIQGISSVLVALGGLWLLAQLLSSPQGVDFFRTVIVVIVIAVATVFAGWLLFRMRTASELQSAIDRAVIEHTAALVRRRAQLVTVDAYGTLQMERWHNELAHFLETQVAPHLGKRAQAIMRRREREFVAFISQHVGNEMKERPAFSSLPSNATGAEFEAYCADKLRAAGWDAHVTKGARDQGVDVIATKDGVRVVLQCKLHSRPIGNKAVQEVIAGKNFERAHYAAVVAATAYTRDAQELAQTNGILLLHHSQLEHLNSMLADWPRGTDCF